jgi:hypothetical protein
LGDERQILMFVKGHANSIPSAPVRLGRQRGGDAVRATIGYLSRKCDQSMRRAAKISDWDRLEPILS